jgi:hypothetical protein
MLYLIREGGLGWVGSVCQDGVGLGMGWGACPDGSRNPPPDRGVWGSLRRGFPEPSGDGSGTPQTGRPDGPKTGQKPPRGVLAKSLDPCMQFRPIPGSQFPAWVGSQAGFRGFGQTPETGSPDRGPEPPVRSLSGDRLRGGLNLGRKVTPVWGDFRVQFSSKFSCLKSVSDFDKTGHRKLLVSDTKTESVF